MKKTINLELELDVEGLSMFEIEDLIQKKVNKAKKIVKKQDK